jgi:DNA replication licensing factor MCM3
MRLGTLFGGATRMSDAHLECRSTLFRQRVASVFAGVFAREEEVSRELLLPELNRGLPTDALFGTMEADQLLAQMNDDNLVMYSESVVYKL